VSPVIYGWLGTLIVAIFLSYVVKPSQAPVKLTKALEENKLDEAVLHYQHRIENDPGDHVAHYQLARIYNVQKRFRASAEEYKQALKGRPQYPWALNNLALTLIETGDANEALKYAKQSCRLTGYLSPEHLAALALAYAATGNFPKAVEIAEKGTEIAELSGNKQLAHNLKQHLQRYKRRQK